MLADSTERKNMLPNKYKRNYSNSSQLKGIHPEVKLDKIGDKSHITDFVLYSMDKSLRNLNIEIKWKSKDFEIWRYPYYDGTIGEGFLVCLKDYDGDCEDFVIDKKANKKTEIPIVYLDTEDFKRWFTVNSYNIISQALANKLKIKPNRLTGRKYWVVTLPKESMNHYINFGRKKYIWAFRDNNNPRNIMNILEDDYIIFVHFNHCNPGRMVYPLYDENKEIETSRGGIVLSKDITWSIGLIDIFKIQKGYHINYSNDELYTGFDEEWTRKGAINPKEKDYTQFIKFEYNDKDYYQYYWNKSLGFNLDRSIFDGNNAQISELISAMRTSLNTRGDAIEITHEAFQSLIQILTTY